MKKQIKNRLISQIIPSMVIFTILILFQSCDDKIESVVNKPTLYIVTDGPKVTSVYGETLPVEFLTNLDWTITSDASWITFPEGASGNESGTVNAIIAKNESGADRNATITMTAGSLIKTLQINQKYRDTSTPQLNITTLSPISVISESAVKSIEFICNISWSASSNVSWITFDGPVTGLEDGTVNIKVQENAGGSQRTGTVTITAGTLTKTIQVVQLGQSTGVEINLLDTPTEDYSFERITTNQSWPPLGEWGGSPSIGVGKFGSSGVSIRVSPGNGVIRTGSSYLFVRMRDNEITTSVDWLWRKLSGLTPGKSYTFSFWYKTPADNANFVQTGNIKLGVVQNETDVATITNPLNGEVTFGYIPSATGVVSSVDEFKKVSYTFVVPTGKTAVYVALVRNGNQQPYLDDMSLVQND